VLRQVEGLIEVGAAGRVDGDELEVGAVDPLGRRRTARGSGPRGLLDVGGKRPGDV